ASARGQLPVERVAVNHDAAPLPGSPQYSFLNSNPFIDGAGNAVFAAGVQGFASGCIFRGPPGALQPVLLTGDAAPGLGPGVTVQSLSGFVYGTPAGQVVMQGTVAGPGYTGSNNYMGWIGAPGGLQLLYRSLDPVAGPTGTV